MLLALAIAFAAAAPADSASSPPAAPELSKICRHVEPPVGTRMGSKRVCKTAAEWKATQGEGFDASKLTGLSR